VITTLAPRPAWAAAVPPAPLFDPPGVGCELFGPRAKHTFDGAPEPFYLAVAAELGVPGLPPATGGEVVVGEVLPDTAPIPLPPTTALPVLTVPLVREDRCRRCDASGDAPCVSRGRPLGRDHKARTRRAVSQ